MDSTAPPSAALTDALVAASRALVGIAVHSVGASPVEVTVAQFRLLVLLAEGHPRTVGDVAGHLGVNQSNASRHCSRLERLGLVTRRRSEEDARVVCVDLTDRGRAVIDAVMDQRRREVQRVLSRLHPAVAAAAVDALDAFDRAARERDDVPWARDPW